MPLDEFGRIRHWTGNRQSPEWLAGQGVIIGIGDDTAVVDPLPPGGGEPAEWQQLLAVDTMVETVHFLESTMTEADIGYKALASNVSDIAAMGGIPRHALISVSAPASWGPERMQRLYDGLYACAAEYGVAVVGGDTTSAPQHLVVSVTLTGAVERSHAITRAGAQPGDAVFVTGPLGMSAAGLHYLLAEAGRPDSDDPLAAAEAAGTTALVRAHRRPQPSIQAGRWLAHRGTCTSLNDVSDGLASETWELAEASGVALVLEEERLPRAGSLSAYASRVGEDPLTWMLCGGEDYVLVGTIASSDAEAARTELNGLGIPFYVIGRVASGEGGASVSMETTSASGTVRRSPVARRGYNHFATSIQEERTDRHDS
ncbi:thiamine-phosphate kinase [Paenibacillus daejeonensis]|uniref:thiamine-phosphate kinase n=1 Tax=Paenibacillus daejeonensis TaxID=135193 RepID=UPI000369F615|nr:thiamine-phosphate kinase [Paenibacillus daejeonensis]